MSQKQNWTVGKALLALFIVIDLIVIGVWLLVYFDKYQDIATVVGGIWAAVLAVLGYFGFSGEQKRSLSELFDLLPVKYISATLTVLILVASLLFVLWEFDTHFIEVTTGTEPAKILIINNDTGEEKESPLPDVTEFRTRIRTGNYQIKVIPARTGYKEITRQVSVRLFQLSVEVPFREFTPVGGVLVVNPVPESVQVDVTQKSTNSRIYSSNINGSTRIPVPEPGKYIIEARANAPHYNPFKQEVLIEVGLTFKLDVIVPRAEGTLFLNPPESNMVIFVNDIKRGRTPKRITLSPGSNYDIVLMKKGQNERLGFYFEQKGVTVQGNSETAIEPARLEQEDLGVIVLAPNPDTNHRYTISDPIQTINLGPARYGKEVHVFPGKITVKKSVNGQVFENTFDIELGQRLEVNL